MDPTLLKDIIQWDVRSWSQALPLWQRHIPEQRPLKALGIGEREGGLSLWLALQGVEVVCTDLNPLPGSTREMHERYGVGARISYEQADATELDHPDGSFDIVIFKSVIGALGSKERQNIAIKEMHRVLRPGGVLLFAENLQGTRLHRWLRKRFVAWDGYWRYLVFSTDRDLFAPFAEFDGHTSGLFSNLGRSERQRDLLSAVDNVLVPVMPAGWRTIWFGAVKKADR